MGVTTNESPNISDQRISEREGEKRTFDYLVKIEYEEYDKEEILDMIPASEPVPNGRD